MALLRETNYIDDFQSYKPSFNKISFQLANQKSALLQPIQHSLSTANQFFDGKRIRRSITRKTVDYNSSFIQLLEERKWQRNYQDIFSPLPDHAHSVELLPPEGYINNPINSVMTKFIRAATNKIKCPIFSVVWTPDGRRLITGASSGEFTLWSGLHFNFETILQAHDTSVRSMIWSHNDLWMVTADHGGYIKYWQSNMNNVKMFQAHKEAIRGLSFSPSDTKFASCADDGTVKIWDFERGEEERILRGHGADVKCLDWHPFKSLIASGSKDNQQPVKLWDPRSGNVLATLHSHKGTVMSLGWNQFNGNWLITGSRDHSLKLFDLRNFKDEIQSFKGHKKDITSLAWHPIHETLFASGSADGTILYWTVGNEKDVGGIEQAHDSIIWSMSWHPMGHILVSGSNDHTTKFWTRNRPGDLFNEKDYQNPLLVFGSMTHFDTVPNIPDKPLALESVSLAASPSKNPMATKEDESFLINNASIATNQIIQENNPNSAMYIPGLDFFDTPSSNTASHASNTESMGYKDQNLGNFSGGDVDPRIINANYTGEETLHLSNKQNEPYNTNMLSSLYFNQDTTVQHQRVQDDYHVRNAPEPNNTLLRNLASGQGILGPSINSLTGGHQGSTNLGGPNPLMAAAARFMLLQSQMRMATALAVGLNSAANNASNNLLNRMNMFNNNNSAPLGSQNRLSFNQSGLRNRGYTDAFHYNANKPNHNQNDQQDDSHRHNNNNNKRFKYNNKYNKHR